MAFKKVADYNEERFGSFFLLRNDQESADVVFLFQSYDDALIASTHYLKSNEYSGYVHCNGRSCPACQKGIKVQTKFFIPLYNLKTNRVEFWDRSQRFENQFMHDVFADYPNPSEFVFRITRHGAAGSIDTNYTITVLGVNTSMPYSKILAENGLKLPDGYSQVCREVADHEMQAMLNMNGAPSASNLPSYDYVPTPRPSYGSTGRFVPHDSMTASDTSGMSYPNVPQVPLVSVPDTAVQSVHEASAEIDVDDDIQDNVDF